MVLDPDLVHPSLAAVAGSLVRHGDVENLGLPEPQRLVAEAIIALLGSARMPDEMREYAHALNAGLDADALGAGRPDGDALRAALIDPLRRAAKAARSLESARSGIAGDLALDYLRLALDDLRDGIALSGGSA